MPLNVDDGPSQRAWLAWLVKLRIIAITFVLGIELVIARLTPMSGNVPQRLFVSVILLWYTIAVFFVLLFSIWQEYRLQARLQVLTDLVFAAAIIYLTGGVDTWFHFLFPLIIIIASILLPRMWSYITALLAFILFGAVLQLSYLEVIHSYSTSHTDPKSLQAVIFINLVADLLVAYLASSLSTRLRQADVALAQKSGALENLQALHENIINSMSGGLITTDLKGKVKLLNSSGQNLLGLAEKDAVGRFVSDLFLDQLPTPADSLGETRAIDAAGQEKIFAVKISGLTVAESGEIGYVYAFDDITQVRRLEREVRMRDRLAAIGRMAAGIAHEIRNPLASIAGSVQVLSAISRLDEEQQSLVDIVVRESERLNAIISDFLVYARDKNYKMVAVDLVALLDDTLHLLSERAPEGKFQFVREFEVAEAWAVLDAERMRQVFWNLGDTALRAMPRGGIFKVALSSNHQHWRVSVSDSSDGLSGQQIEKIFEPFQANFEGGTGLALAIVYQIMQAHGARIAVHSTPGQGTEFVLDLKKAVRPQPRMREEAAPEKVVTHG